MEQFNVIGYEFGDYVRRTDQQKICFTRIFCTYPFDSTSDKLCDGHGTVCLFLPKPVVGLSLGQNISPVYNKWGKCVDIIFNE